MGPLHAWSACANSSVCGLCCKIPVEHTETNETEKHRLLHGQLSVFGLQGIDLFARINKFGRIGQVVLQFRSIFAMLVHAGLSTSKSQLRGALARDYELGNIVHFGSFGLQWCNEDRELGFAALFGQR